MHRLRLTLILSIVALSACALASASASALEFLDNVTGNTFTATSGAGELRDVANGLSIKCEKDTVTLANGKITGAKTIEVVVDFEQCTFLGVVANSLGDVADTTGNKRGLILAPAKGELCTIKAGEVGVFFTVPLLHIEVPSLGELLEVNGTALGVITPLKSLTTGPYTLELKKAGPKECGVKKAKLAFEINHNGTPLEAEEITKEAITADKDLEIME